MPLLTHLPQFWLVYGDTPDIVEGTTITSQPAVVGGRHVVKQDAVDEAARLAKQHPGTTFYLLQPVGVMLPVEK